MNDGTVLSQLCSWHPDTLFSSFNLDKFRHKIKKKEKKITTSLIAETKTWTNYYIVKVVTLPRH